MRSESARTGTGRRRGGETQRRTKRQQCKLSQAPGRRRRTSPPARRSWAAGFRRACRKGTTTSSGGIVFVARALQSSLACFNVDQSIDRTDSAGIEWVDVQVQTINKFCRYFLLIITLYIVITVRRRRRAKLDLIYLLCVYHWDDCYCGNKLNLFLLYPI